MSCRAESRDEPAKNRFISRLAGIGASFRGASRDRRLLLAFDDRMLRDIGLARDDVLHGMPKRAAQNSTSPAMAWRISGWTILVVMVSLIVALIAPDGSKVDPLRFTSCALFPQGIMGASIKGVPKCGVSYGTCRIIPGAPKHVC
jgi:uncharacterized protein YjiS (DUF1127 family)